MFRCQGRCFSLPNSGETNELNEVGAVFSIGVERLRPDVSDNCLKLFNLQEAGAAF